MSSIPTTSPEASIIMNELPEELTSHYDLRCCWASLKAQLLCQWDLLTEQDLENTGPNAIRIARLIAHKYGVSSAMVEHYLANFSRTIPFQ